MVGNQTPESENSEGSSVADSSSDSENSCHSEEEASENNGDKVAFYRWQTIDKKICKAKIEMNFNTAKEMFKEKVAVLKEHIHIKRRQVNAHHEMKDSFKDDDLMVQVDFTESYKNEQEDVILSAYFGNHCFSIFTACYYSKVSGKIKNDKL